MTTPTDPRAVAAAEEIRNQTIGYSNVRPVNGLEWMGDEAVAEIIRRHYAPLVEAARAMLEPDHTRSGRAAKRDALRAALEGSKQ